MCVCIYLLTNIKLMYALPLISCNTFKYNVRLGEWRGSLIFYLSSLWFKSQVMLWCNGPVLSAAVPNQQLISKKGACHRVKDFCEGYSCVSLHMAPQRSLLASQSRNKSFDTASKTADKNDFQFKPAVRNYQIGTLACTLSIFLVPPMFFVLCPTMLKSSTCVQKCWLINWLIETIMDRFISNESNHWLQP